jgi:hypothetical protein
MSLIALTDEATGRTLARLTRQDSVEENLQALRRYVTAWGRPLRIRTDRSTLFGGVAGSPREGVTYGGRQIRRALAELDIEWTPAESPHEPGYSAFFFENAREQFRQELGSARVRTFKSAASYLESVYVPKWNDAIAPSICADRHCPLRESQDLESILSVVESRQISSDGTIRFDHALYRIVDLAASSKIAGAEVQIERRANGKILARWDGRHLDLKRIDKQDVARGNRSPAPPRKPRSSNRAWMAGFFERPVLPIWKLYR